MHNTQLTLANAFSESLLYMLTTSVRGQNYSKPLPVARSAKAITIGLSVMQIRELEMAKRSANASWYNENLTDFNFFCTSLALFSVALRLAVQAFIREEESHVNYMPKRRRERYDLQKGTFVDSMLTDQPRAKGVQFPFAVMDRVIIKGNKRTPQRFVGREAIVTSQCLNGWYVVKTLDNAESVKLQYRSLAKVSESPSSKPLPMKATPNWL
ncbi:hypothetical protein SASPL_123372 [Salvia splendens]|uniref:PUB 62/63 C-terminal domain-containing protein n=1 Tax=Salvia splendens TaxID=180675 RepID=A0A8X8XR22_SALSN|nr:hypothetical protein SASPL_123372 [Salvia splendens]